MTIESEDTGRALPVAGPARPQRGAVLFVSMIMLLVLSLLSVSTMNMTNIELKIASNTQNQNHCFQIAETGISRTMGAAEGQAYAIDFTDRRDQMNLGTVTNDINATATVGAEFRGQTIGLSCPGSSMRRFSCMHFEIQSNGLKADANAACQHVQGVFRVATQPRT